MSPPAELSFDEILKFMLAHNGKVTNHELVKHFKVFLMNPDMRDEARSTFKKHVNALAIIKNQNNEKWLILKKKYLTNSGKENEEIIECKNPEIQNESEPISELPTQPPYRPPPPLQLNQDFNILNNIVPDVTPITSPLSPVELQETTSKESITDDVPPKVHPRRRSSDKAVLDKSFPGHSIQPPVLNIELKECPLTTSQSDSMLVENEQKISVKERKQMFNRMASESDVLKSHQLSFNSSVDEEDRASLEHKETDPLDPKQKQWILCAARGEYHTLAKMCKENAKLVRTKRSPVFQGPPVKKNYIRSYENYKCESLIPSRYVTEFSILGSNETTSQSRLVASVCSLLKPSEYRMFVPCPADGHLRAALQGTAMHWACKRGDENLVKLLAGVHRHIVHERSNGGYTPLHLAMQYRHENVYRLLVEVYDADPNARDWSGRKPRQYLVHLDTSLSPGSYRTPTVQSSHRVRRTATVAAGPSPYVALSHLPANEKEGFLRIGSLNVRVKKTTEAFSNFLGVGATRAAAYAPKPRDRDSARRADDGEALKAWGSADNIQKGEKMMPPPSGKVRRRGASGRRAAAAHVHSRSTPSTPDQPRAQLGAHSADSDSDSAAGFHSAWRQQS